MRISGYLLFLLLIGFLTPTSVCAETIIYLRGHAFLVPPWIVLLMGGLALLAIGDWLRRLGRG